MGATDVLKCCAGDDDEIATRLLDWRFTAAGLLKPGEYVYHFY